MKQLVVLHHELDFRASQM